VVSVSEAPQKKKKHENLCSHTFHISFYIANTHSHIAKHDDRQARPSPKQHSTSSKPAASEQKRTGSPLPAAAAKKKEQVRGMV